MADKKYNEFSNGTISSSKIFLIADPSTGELTKIDFNDITGIQKAIFKISQSGTANPTINGDIWNITGASLSMIRNSAGSWNLIASQPIFSATSVNNVIIAAGYCWQSGFAVTLNPSYISSTVLRIYVHPSNAQDYDNIFARVSLYILS